MNYQKKIARLSSFLRVVSIFFIIIVPLVYAAYWITNGFSFLPKDQFFSLELLPQVTDVEMMPLEKMPSYMKLFGFLVMLLPLGIFEITMYFFIRLLNLFKRLIIFSKLNVKLIKYIGITILVGQLIVHPIYSALISLVMTFLNPPGERMINIYFGTSEFVLIGVGLIVMLIAYIMEEGYEIYEEQKHVI